MKMKCQEAKNLIDDFLDEYLEEPGKSELETHLTQCPDCRAELGRIRVLREQLRAIPVPPPSPGFEERALRQAGHSHRVHVGFAAGFGSAIAAGLLVWFAVGFWQPSGLPGQDSLSVIAMQIEQPQEVSLAFNVPEALQDVTFRIELPEGVELQGYPKQRELVWKDHLNKGRNVMSLNLVAKQGTTGELRAYISQGGRERVFHVPVVASMKGVGIKPASVDNTISI
jgi:hypothetical protein